MRAWHYARRKCSGKFHLLQMAQHINSEVLGYCIPSGTQNANFLSPKQILFAQHMRKCYGESFPNGFPSTLWPKGGAPTIYASFMVLLSLQSLHDCLLFEYTEYNYNIIILLILQ